MFRATFFAIKKQEEDKPTVSTEPVKTTIPSNLDFYFVAPEFDEEVPVIRFTGGQGLEKLFPSKIDYSEYSCHQGVSLYDFPAAHAVKFLHALIKLHDNNAAILFPHERIITLLTDLKNHKQLTENQYKFFEKNIPTDQDDWELIPDKNEWLKV